MSVKFEDKGDKLQNTRDGGAIINIEGHIHGEK